MCAPPAGELPAGRCIPGRQRLLAGPGLPPSGVCAPGEEAATQDVPEDETPPVPDDGGELRRCGWDRTTDTRLWRPLLCWAAGPVVAPKDW